jgi:uncharacterized protein
MALVALCILTCATSALSAATGLGGGSILVIVLAYFFPSHALIQLHAVIQVTSNVSRLSASYYEIPWQRLKLLGIGSLTGVFACITTGDILSSTVLEVLLPFAIIFLTWSKELQRTSPYTLPNLDYWWRDILLGFLASCSSTFFGVSGPLLSACLVHSLPRDELVLSVAVINMSIHLLKIIGFLFFGFPLLDWIGTLFPLCSAAVVGSYIGTSIRHWLNQARFQLSIKIVITILCLGKTIQGI